MFCAEKMDRTTLLILQGDAEAVFNETARVGVLHPARIETTETWASELRPLESRPASHEYDVRSGKLAFLTRELAVRPEAIEMASRTVGPTSAQHLDEAIARIEAAALPLLSSRDALRARLAELKELSNRSASFMALGLPLEGLARSSLLVSALGVIDSPRLATLEELLATAPVLILPCGEDRGQLRLFCVTLRSFQAVLEKSLQAVGFRETVRAKEFCGASDSFQTSLQDEVGRLESELAAVDDTLRAVGREEASELIELACENEDLYQLGRIGAAAVQTGKACLFAGWTPRDQTQDLVNAVMGQTGGRALVEISAPEEGGDGPSVDVPVLQRRPKFLEPFGLVVENFGAPTYTMVDPTLFVGIAFLAMFGMMFGDLGHGAVLAGAGLFLELRHPAHWKLGRLFTYCGLSGMLFGILFGSIFGFESVLPALWVKPFHNIETLFKTAIGFGVTVVSVGILLNIVNAVRARTFGKQFFDLSGPLAGAAYGVGVWTIVRYISAPSGQMSIHAGVWLFAALLLSFFLKGPALRLMGHTQRVFPEGAPAYAMESIVGAAEFLTGYLANTVSFVRVAAFGLAHAGLLIAVFGVSDLVAPAPLGGLLSLAVIVAGNAFVIVFEGAVVTIQILRLEYYEFFGKFFKTFGVKYAPVRFGHAGASSTT